MTTLPEGRARAGGSSDGSSLHGAGRGRLLARGGAILPGIVFLAAAYSKAIDPRPTAVAINEILFSNRSLVKPAVYALALFEVALGAVLVAGVAQGVAGLVTTVLLGCFTVWILRLLVFDLRIECGCALAPNWFNERQAQWFALMRNIALLGASAVVWNVTPRMSAHGAGGASADCASSATLRTRSEERTCS